MGLLRLTPECRVRMGWMYALSHPPAMNLDGSSAPVTSFCVSIRAVKVANKHLEVVATIVLVVNCD